MHINASAYPVPPQAVLKRIRRQFSSKGKVQRVTESIGICKPRTASSGLTTTEISATTTRHTGGGVGQSEAAERCCRLDLFVTFCIKTKSYC